MYGYNHFSFCRETGCKFRASLRPWPTQIKKVKWRADLLPLLWSAQPKKRAPTDTLSDCSLTVFIQLHFSPRIHSLEFTEETWRRKWGNVSLLSVTAGNSNASVHRAGNLSEGMYWPEDTACPVLYGQLLLNQSWLLPYGMAGQG